MALPKRKVFMMIGSSNMEGRIAYLTEVPQDDFSRWTGGDIPDPPKSPFTVTTDHTTETIIKVAHGVVNGTRVILSTTGSAPTGLTAGTNYFARDVTANDFKLALTPGGVVVTFTSNGTGTHTITPKLFPFQRPYHITVPGIRLYTLRMPYSTNIQRSVDTGSTSTDVKYKGGDLTIKVNSWLYIPRTTPGNITVPTAQGQFRKVTVDGASQVTVTPAMQPVVSENDTVAFLDDSHTVLTNTTAFINGNPVSKITRDAGTANFVAGDVGRFVVFPESMDGDNLPPDNGPDTVFYSARVLAFDPAFPAEITLDRAVPATVAGVGKCMVLLTGANSVQSLTAMQPPNAVMQDLTFYVDELGPCYLTGTDYSNYNNQPYAAPKVYGGLRPLDPAQINSIPELTWRLRQRFDEPIDCIQIGIGGSMVSPLYHYAPQFAPQGTPAAFLDHFSWLHDIHGFDFHPGSDKSLFLALTNEIAGIRTLLAAEGLEPDFDCCFINLADNDEAHENRLPKIGENHRIVRDALRVLTNNPQMKFIIAGPSKYGAVTTYDGDVRDDIYAQLNQLAADDPYTGVLDTRDDSYAKSPLDGLHYSALGQIQLGKGFFATYEEVCKRANDAARIQAELLTLATLRTRVKRRYERSDTGNDATPAQVDQFINDSIRELYNTLGDEKAWFLRRVEQIDVSAGLFPNTITLPRQVKRLLRIEPTNCPGMQLTWKGLAHTDEGRTQVTLHTTTTGPFNVHFIMLTKDLGADTDVAIIPEEYSELVVVLACKRLTECAGNTTMAQYYAAESARLWQQVKRACQLHSRMQQPQLEMLGAYDSWTNSAWSGGTEEWL